MNVGSRGRGVAHSARPAGDQTEIGNRRTFEEIKVPPDNIGNKVDGEFGANFVHDSVGNSLDEEPSHLKSGILSSLVPEKNQNLRNRRVNNFSSQTSNRGPMHNSQVPSNYPQRMQAAPKQEHQNPRQDGEQYMAKLNREFATLLKERSGMPFSFSMKPLNDNEVLILDVNTELDNLGTIIKQILKTNSIQATVKLEQYKTNAHHFAIYFLKPKEIDATKNKELIAALRQVVNGYAENVVASPINIFLVLANAQAVIEEHLTKIGAKKIETP